jgi:hypothetical protein
VNAVGAPDAAAARPERYLFIDLFRALIILLMLEGHVLRQFLTPEVRSTSAFFLHEVFHGITAPAFLFGAGLTFVISSHRRWTEFHRWSDELRRRLRRIVMIFLIGIFMHLPYFSFRKTLLEATPIDVLVLFQSDVLTCISGGLLILHLLLFFFRSEDRFHGTVVTLLIAVVLLTPVVWEVDFLHFTPVLFAQLSNSLHGSPFPFFPFLAYLFAGVAVSRKFIVATEAGAVPRFMKKMAVGGGLLIAVGLLSAAVPFTLYRTYDFWYTSPSYFVVRLGLLFVIAPAVWRAAGRIGPRARHLLILGRESLFVYVLHLLVLYGSVINPRFNLVGLLPARLGIAESIALFAGLAALMYAAARAWQALRSGHPAAYRLTQAAIGTVVLMLFFMRDY